MSDRSARVARYNASPKGKARNARYDASPKGKARVARYDASPKGKARYARQSFTAIYAIAGPAGVYVGKTTQGWRRSTLNLARLLGLPFGIFTEMPGSTAAEQVLEEVRVAELFRRRGVSVVSSHQGPTAAQRMRVLLKQEVT